MRVSFFCYFFFFKNICCLHLKGLLDAQHHSVYIPNYLQTFDYPNVDEAASLHQQQEHSDDQFNDGFDPFQFDLFPTTETPSAPYLVDTSNANIDISTNNLTINSNSTIPTISDVATSASFISSTFDSTLMTTEQITTEQMITEQMTTEQMTTERMTTTENSTYASLLIDTTLINNDTFTSNEIFLFSNENNTVPATLMYSTESNEPMSTNEQINDTTESTSTIISATETIIKNDTDLIINLLNHTYLQGKSLNDNKHSEIYNTTAEEAAKHLADRRTMQSLIHLLPPNLWSQLQNNFSFFNLNQSQFIPPSLPDPVLLAEAAAQAGLPPPGPYPIPDQFWHRNPNYYGNPPNGINKIPVQTSSTTTCKLIFFFFKLVIFLFQLF